MIIFTGWGMPNIGHFFLALDTAAFGDPDVFSFRRPSGAIACSLRA
ncbi:hypothetical protein CSC12_1692 [Klebsiella michiganensis]|jgi:hypothetical protein|nr:hypothetical protein CSC12_1692 [Klebsiella michiganensis]